MILIFGASRIMGLIVATRLPDVKSAIQSGEIDVLRELLAKDPAGANRLIEWGKNCEIRTHPLHYVSDMLFDSTLARGREIPLVEALLEAGADPNHQAANGETPLIGAASLNAQDVGLRLLHAGARLDSRGMWDATALHWASISGLERLVAKLIQLGAELDHSDTHYNSPPLVWAIHGHLESPSGGQETNCAGVIRLLVSAGAKVKPEWLTDEKVRADPTLWTALSSNRPT